jgi:hypothetical protein
VCVWLGGWFGSVRIDEEAQSRAVMWRRKAMTGTR